MEVGRLGMTRLLELIESPGQGTQRSLITPTLTRRNSTAPPAR
jgi:hypothetical protein